MPSDTSSVKAGDTGINIGGAVGNGGGINNGNDSPHFWVGSNNFTSQSIDGKLILGNTGNSDDHIVLSDIQNSQIKLHLGDGFNNLMLNGTNNLHGRVVGGNNDDFLILQDTQNTNLEFVSGEGDDGLVFNLQGSGETPPSNNHITFNGGEGNDQLSLIQATPNDIQSIVNNGNGSYTLTLPNNNKITVSNIESVQFANLTDPNASNLMSFSNLLEIFGNP